VDVIWSRRALQSLDEIFAYIARDNRAAAARWVDRLVKRAESAATNPLARRTPELDRNDVREVFERTYRIVYRVREDAIVILVVFEGHKLLRPGDIDEGA
jgi:plasmid stabilization system protein ParE